LVSSAIVSYKLGRADDDKNDGEITFGFVLLLHYTLSQFDFFFLLSSGADPTKFDSSTLVNLPNIDKGFWECKMDAVSVNGRDLKLADRTNILDTGGLSAFLFLPKSIK
jgi:hypothetical protein